MTEENYDRVKPSRTIVSILLTVLLLSLLAGFMPSVHQQGQVPQPKQDSITITMSLDEWNLIIYQVDTAANLIRGSGSLPGNAAIYVYGNLMDARIKLFNKLSEANKPKDSPKK